jgi:hypothetical protein
VRSRDRGCKGHRILRRVLVDGRHPGLYEPSAFTSRWSRQPRRLPPRSKRARRRAHRDGKRVRRQGCQRLDRNGRRGKNYAHARAAPVGVARGNVSDCRSAEAVIERRETLGPPVKPRRAQTLRGVHAAKVAVANRERARCGYTQVVRVAEVDQTHRASCPLVGRKIGWRQQGASRKEARSTA